MKIQISYKRLSKGFTLAEILVTLAIIGVIATIVIPTLLNNTNDDELRVAAKKTYATITQALALMQANSGGGNLWNKMSDNNEVRANAMRNEFGKYLNFTRTNLTKNIFAPYYRNYKESGGWGISSDTWPAAINNNGTFWRFIDYKIGAQTMQTCSFNSSLYITGGNLGNICGEVCIDTNGKKGPNMFGKDFLSFWIVKKSTGTYQVLPKGNNDDGYLYPNCDIWNDCGLGLTYNMVMDLPLP